MRRPYAHISIPIAVLQVVAVVAGVFLTRLGFANLDGQDLDARHFRVPLLVHHHGYFLLALPLLWTGAVVWLENRPGDRWSRRWTVVTGLVLLAALSIFLYEVCTQTFWRRALM